VALQYRKLPLGRPFAMVACTRSACLPTAKLPLPAHNMGMLWAGRGIGREGEGGTGALHIRKLYQQRSPVTQVTPTATYMLPEPAVGALRVVAPPVWHCSVVFSHNPSGLGRTHMGHCFRGSKSAIKQAHIGQAVLSQAVRPPTAPVTK
jgi:hypothetical protein